MELHPQQGQSAFEIGETPRIHPILVAFMVVMALAIGASLAWAPIGGSISFTGIAILLCPSVHKTFSR